MGMLNIDETSFFEESFVKNVRETMRKLVTEAKAELRGIAKKEFVEKGRIEFLKEYCLRHGDVAEAAKAAWDEIHYEAPKLEISTKKEQRGS